MPKRHRATRASHRVLARIEEIVLASSGADAFELLFALVAARLFDRERGARPERTRRAVGRALSGVSRAWPWLGVSRELDVSDDVLALVLSLVDGLALDREPGEALDALFEQLVTRVGKGEKGQFFTPRHVVDFAVRALAPERGEVVVDPACGSGAFLGHARARARVRAIGCDVDLRAVRVARLLSLAAGADPSEILRADGLVLGARDPLPTADVIATNPPFAGRVAASGYEMTSLVRSPERDALFVERCVRLLRPGGRMAIVLPYNKISADAWSPLRTWLVDRARVFAVVALARETFLPHTSQRTALVFAKKRVHGGAVPEEKVFLAVSERAGKNAAGEPVFADLARTMLDHDLGEVLVRLEKFLAKERFAS